MQEPPGKSVSPTRQVALFLGPLLFLVLLFGFDPVPERPEVGRTLAVAVWMAVYWLTEAVPMAATSLLPVVLFPVLGVMNATSVSPLYVNNIIFLFIGGFLLAIAMERWGLHRRIALRILTLVGQSPTRLLFGFLAASWVMSGWVSNTATTLMMVPIVLALSERFSSSEKGGASAMTVCLLLGVAYASSIGGMYTLIGTAPNLSFARIFTQSFPEAPPMGFVRWMTFALPVSFVMLMALFVYMRIVVLRQPPVTLDASVIRDEFRALGSPAFEEKCVFWAFCVFVVLIVTRGDVVVGDATLRGWASRLGVRMVSDGTVSVAVALLLFLLPSRRPGGFVLEGDAFARLPWDIILLLGGGFALAQAFQVSGLSEYLGGQLAGLGSVHPFVMMLAMCTAITFLTELTSNTATTQVVLPIVASMCVAIGVNPLFLMVPVTLTASCAFMLPVATPPNAIVFGTHRIRVDEMARVGLALNAVGIVVVSVLMYTLGRAVFGIDLDTPPQWLR